MLIFTIKFVVLLFLFLAFGFLIGFTVGFISGIEWLLNRRDSYFQVEEEPYNVLENLE